MQATYYHPGLGTMEPAGALTTFARKITKLLGMAIGYGLENYIRHAYVFIMQNFEPWRQALSIWFQQRSLYRPCGRFAVAYVRTHTNRQ